ncbi:heptosyltransferase-3 [Candidatus Frackibacter sp. WG12]|nr:heptosyltransferase-3 [Candidatus Frackibacter sp. WG11]SEM38150.1 heptosyltransferase-3 [Candidatus Frackibacter sp. WG12]SFL43690.1 heptosyltransferase-3 [Candidatus Frackibacter sp. WG13]
MVSTMKQSRIEKILILDFLAIGDLVFITPLLKTLSKNYPDAEIEISIQKQLVDILRYNPHIDRIIPFDKKGDHSSLSGYLSYIKELRAVNADLTITLQDNPRLALLAKLSGAPRRIGFARHWSRKFFYTDPVYPNDKQHRVNYYLDIARALPEVKDIYDEGLEMYVNEREKEEIKDFLAKLGVESNDRVIGLNIGGNWPTKRWPREKFAQLGDALVQQGYKVIILGGPGDVEDAELIRQKMKEEVLIAAGKTTLLQLAALEAELDVVISGDTGPMHMAVAMGAKVVALFGPTETWRYRPYGDEHQVITLDLDCQPCHEKECSEREWECMKELDVGEVLENVEEMVEEINDE